MLLALVSPLRVYNPAFSKNTRKAFGFIAPPLRVICVKKIA